MAWELSRKGFLMTLSSYVPQLIEEDIASLVDACLEHHHINKTDITHWCIHPGGKKILEVIEQKLRLQKDDLCYSRKVLAKYGNMSSPTILFVLKEMWNNIQHGSNIFGVAFGPGLTMETFLAPQHELTHRSYQKELLDCDDIPFEDIKKNMQELNFINTWLGGHSITIKGLQKLVAITEKQLLFVK